MPTASATEGQSGASQTECCREGFGGRGVELVAKARTALLGKAIVDVRMDQGDRSYEGWLVIVVEGGVELAVTSSHGSSGMPPVFVISEPSE